MKIIGQKNLTKLIDNQIKSGDFPRFSIIVGDYGSGKKTLANYIIDEMKVTINYNSGISVSQIRDAIAQMHKTVDKSVFTFFDADNMSAQAENALLKVSEEIPNNVYIIMTVSDISSILPTIKSRAIIYHIPPYSIAELLKYAHEVVKAKYDDDIISQLCETPGEINLLYERDAEALWEYAYKAIDNIAEVGGANAFKMANKIDFKGDDAEKFDMQLFLKAFRQICTEKMSDAVIDGDKDNINKYGAGIDVVNHIIQQLHITGINKSALFDMFILDIRKEWM